MKSFKYKIRRPSKSIQTQFNNWLDACRELYNAALQERRDAWRLNRVSIGYHAQCAQLPDIKFVREDIAEVNAQVLQATLRRLSQTFDGFFARIRCGEKPGYPRFKPSSQFNSFTFPQMHGVFNLNGDRLRLSKIGSCRIHLHRPIEGKIKTCTIKREAGGWYAIFVCETESYPLPKTGQSVGIDVGLDKFATLTQGEPIDNPRYLRKAERKLKTAQRSVSRKKRGGANRRKSVRLLQKQHLKVKRQRLDFFHKESLKLIKRFDEIAVEDLNISNMMTSHALAKSISDAAWGTFLDILESKAENAAKRVWRVNPRGTSQTCSNCGATVKKSLNVRIHRCSCGLEMNRDLNAAFNILARSEPALMSSVRLTSDARSRLL